MYCKQCGRELSDQAIYCRYCGTRCADEEVEPVLPTPEKPKRRWLLPIILGLVALCILAAIIIWLSGSKAAPIEPVNDPTAVEDTEQEPDPVNYTLKITGKAEANVGENIILNVDISPLPTILKYEWISSDTTVATVNDGTVTALKPGKTVIHASFTLNDGQILEKDFPFTVAEPPVEYTAVLEPEALELAAGSAESFAVVITADPAQEEINATTEWKTSDPKIAAVSEGRIQAVGEGEAVITALVSLPTGKTIHLTGKVIVTPAPQADPPQIPENSSGSQSQSGSQSSQGSQSDPGSQGNQGSQSDPGSQGNQGSQSDPGSQSNPGSQTDPTPTPPPTYPEGEALITTEDYLISNSSTAFITVASLRELTTEQLIIARNEIFARHGRRFMLDWLREYFEGKSWYEGTIDPEVFDVDLDQYFNTYEYVNVARIQQIEAERED